LKSPLAHEPFTGGSLDRIENSRRIANAIKNDIGEMSVGSALIGSENRDCIDGHRRVLPLGGYPRPFARLRDTHMHRIAGNQDTTPENVPDSVRRSDDTCEIDGL
jgi:hypothetical protein